ncbi:MAG TPA: hypothetical protein VM695_10165 [Phycisphaerae bacterium]|nr:hypothetical protein [Phycisphaerae bacterium]
MGKSYASSRDPFGGRVRDETAEERNERLRAEARRGAPERRSAFPMREVPDLEGVYAGLEQAAAQRVARARADWGKGVSGRFAPRERSSLWPSTMMRGAKKGSRRARLLGMSPAEAMLRAEGIRNPRKRKGLTSALEFAARAGTQERAESRAERQVGVQEAAEQRLARGQRADIQLAKRGAGREDRRLSMDEKIHDADMRQRKITMEQGEQLFPSILARQKAEVEKFQLELGEQKDLVGARKTLDAATARAGQTFAQVSSGYLDHNGKYSTIIAERDHIVNLALKLGDKDRAASITQMADMQLNQLRGPEVQKAAQYLDGLVVPSFEGKEDADKAARWYLTNLRDPAVREEAEKALYGSVYTRTQNMEVASRVLHSMGVSYDRILMIKKAHLDMMNDQAAYTGKLADAAANLMAGGLEGAAQQVAGGIGGQGGPMPGPQGGPPPVPGFNTPAAAASNAPGAAEAARLRLRTIEAERVKRLKESNNVEDQWRVSRMGQ